MYSNEFTTDPSQMSPSSTESPPLVPPRTYFVDGQYVYDADEYILRSPQSRHKFDVEDRRLKPKPKHNPAKGRFHRLQGEETVSVPVPAPLELFQSLASLSNLGESLSEDVPECDSVQKKSSTGPNSSLRQGGLLSPMLKSSIDVESAVITRDSQDELDTDHGGRKNSFRHGPGRVMSKHWTHSNSPDEEDNEEESFSRRRSLTLMRQRGSRDEGNETGSRRRSLTLLRPPITRDQLPTKSVLRGDDELGAKESRRRSLTLTRPALLSRGTGVASGADEYATKTRRRSHNSIRPELSPKRASIPWSSAPEELEEEELGGKVSRRRSLTLLRNPLSRITDNVEPMSSVPADEHREESSTHASRRRSITMQRGNAPGTEGKISTDSADGSSRKSLFAISPNRVRDVEGNDELDSPFTNSRRRSITVIRSSFSPKSPSRSPHVFLRSEIGIKDTDKSETPRFLRTKRGSLKSHRPSDPISTPSQDDDGPRSRDESELSSRSSWYSDY
mmetsp:Transcript_13027/g.26412  ORF Transcript_13027/g.26412 Transcript_13027/m.26412 type:complete len:504 (-) Transcript_13027:711-2222(-)